ncbi:EF-hand calcium-binding domain-containing protein 4B [Merluccius polli]|uniref:EF-hand calcium-binding domain-containing protein 4B n=1 Tax=Merluccius polli TaxID=89951 RepID=A0AA47M1F4_MERPO|nr:EF-hand calcium-binding domain-containing protein 4B [Merluccius polli]
MEEEGRLNGVGTPGRRGSDWGEISLLDRNKEFFQICDVEAKGFITRTDMRRLHRELPLSEEELEDVFDSLDTGGGDGYLTLEAFSSGFSQFLRGRRFSTSDDLSPTPASRLRVKETLYQSQWDAKLAGGEEDEEERHFSMLLESLGAGNVFEDPGEVRSLWAQLRKDEPHLLSNFEEFLARVTYQIKEAKEEKKEMESALQRKAATHDTQIRRLYEEMEAQIKNEKDRLHLKDSEREHLHSQDLEHQLVSKERELDQLFHKQRRLERECCELSSERKESHVENVKLKVTNEELSRELDSTCQELSLAQEQLALLQQQASRLHQEKEMEMYRITEGLQREKQSLMKQLDLLREMNKHLKDERDICHGMPRSSLRKKQKQQKAGLANLFDDPSQQTKTSSLLVDRSFQSLEALPLHHLQIVFVASSSCSEDDSSTSYSAPSFFSAPGAYASANASANAPACPQKKSPAKISGGGGGLANGYAADAARAGKFTKAAKVKRAPGRTGAAKRVHHRERGRVGGRTKEQQEEEDEDEEGLDAPPDGWPLRRVISIEEDHLPHLLHGEPQPLLHQLSEEEEEEDDDEDDDEEEEDEEVGEEAAAAQSDTEAGGVMTGYAAASHSSYVPRAFVAAAPAVAAAAAAPVVTKSHFSRVAKTPMSPRGQPVGKETQQRVKEGALSVPERLFKVVLVGNSSVGKTSLLRSFCEGRFHPSTSATVGIDYSVKTLTLDSTQVAMQLWDTAGQERYRSITKQFFRKADGVVVMYDVTVEETFKAVRPWLANVQEAAGEGIPILLLGNKMDMDAERQVSYKEAVLLAEETQIMFYEVSAYTGNMVAESLTHLARVLKEQEDRVRDTTIILTAQPVKKKACCK